MDLRRWRESEGLTQEQLAAQICVHPQYLSQIERGVRRPGGRVAMRIHQRSGGKVPLEQLLAQCNEAA